MAAPRRSTPRITCSTPRTTCSIPLTICSIPRITCSTPCGLPASSSGVSLGPHCWSSNSLLLRADATPGARRGAPPRLHDADTVPTAHGHCPPPCFSGAGLRLVSPCPCPSRSCFPLSCLLALDSLYRLKLVLPASYTAGLYRACHQAAKSGCLSL